MKNILITGGSGFVGTNLQKYLQNYDFHVYAPNRYMLDCSNLLDLIAHMSFHKIDIVIHLAGVVGGIEKNRNSQADSFFQNVVMGANIFEACKVAKVSKLVALGAGCGAPNGLVPPFKESDFFDGLPDFNSLGYSMAKKNLIIQSWVYRKQHNLNSTILLPANLYGPNDNFDLTSSHVVPAVIRKFVEAKQTHQNHVELWGSGDATREFLFVDDVCEAIVRAIDVNKSGPFNLGTGIETSIRELALKIKEIVGFRGYIQWNKEMPDGQSRRFYDMTLFQKEFGYVPSISVDDGLKKTIKWFEENQENARL